MPKLKTNSSAKKRFRRTGSGYKTRRANRNHILTKHTTKRKRHARGQQAIHKNDVAAVRRMLNHS